MADINGPWAKMLEERKREITSHPRFMEIALALIDAHRWHSRHYTAAAQAADHEALARGRPSNNYWMEVACRALLMLDLSPAEREQLISEARAIEEVANAACLANIKAFNAEQARGAKLRSHGAKISLEDLDL